MVPLPVNPKVVVQIKNGQVIGIASNIDSQLEVIVVDNQKNVDSDIVFFELSKGMPFNSRGN